MLCVIGDLKQGIYKYMKILSEQIFLIKLTTSVLEDSWEITPLHDNSC